MTKLVKQPTFQPTRKMYAFAVAAAAVAGLRSILTAMFPDIEIAPLVAVLRPRLSQAPGT